MKGILLKTEGFGAGSYGAFAPADTHPFIKASGVLSQQLHHQIALVCCACVCLQGKEVGQDF